MENTCFVRLQLPKPSNKGGFAALVPEFNLPFKTRINRAHDVMYQCCPAKGGLI